MGLQDQKRRNNKLIHFCTCLVARGFSQIFGIDFDETYAPVVRIDTVRHLLALAAFYGLHILHADAKTVFIDGDSHVEIYIEQPEGFIDPQHPYKVLLLNKSLYGLKQAPRIWYLLLCDRILAYGFTICESDHCVYFHAEWQMFIVVYIDNVLIFGRDEA